MFLYETKSQQLMFINKTADSASFSHSKGNERIRIHRHAYRNRRSEKSQDGTLHANSSIVQAKYPRTKAVTSKGNPVTWGRELMLSFKSLPTATMTTTSQEQSDATVSPANVLSELQHQTCFSLQIPTFPMNENDLVDPFGVTCVQVDPIIHKLLLYFIYVHHPNIWRLEHVVRSDKAYKFQCDAKLVVQTCLGDEYSMYCLLASMNGHMLHMEGIETGKDDCHFISKAITASQEYIKNGLPITTLMIFNTFHLGCAEWSRNNAKAAYIHLRAVKSMVDASGGLETLDQQFAELLVLGDGYLAAELQKKPLFSHQELPPGDESPMEGYGVYHLRKLLSGSIPTGAGLLLSSQHLIVPSTLRCIILDLAVGISILNSYFPTRMDRVAPVAVVHWVFRRTLINRHCLLDLEFEDKRIEAIRIALIMWTLRTTGAGRKRTSRVMAPHLLKTMVMISQAHWNGHDEIRAWILTIGAISAAPYSNENKWFIGELRSQCFCEIRDSRTILQNLIERASRFLMLGAIECEALEELSHAIVAASISQR